jgi:mannose-6-phosphate isomerase
VQRVHGVVQRYAWGDPAFIPSLLGVEPDGGPWAEFWVGTHPNGPATLDDGRALGDVAGDLPYLLKVLAAAQPLSLQAHPDGDQAREGYERGVYPDPNAKPELLCALTEFEAFCGVRPAEATLALLDDLRPQGPGTGALGEVLKSGGVHGVLRALYDGSIERQAVVETCAGSGRGEAVWVCRLAERYPDDPSVVATLLLNLVHLAPGEALRLGPGNLHAYLYGAAVELMGPSDNVVRAGLTTKLVDVDELLRIVDTTPLTEPVLADTGSYRLNDDIRLVRLAPGDTHRAVGHEVSIDLAGQAWYLAPGEERRVTAVTYAVTS